MHAASRSRSLKPMSWAAHPTAQVMLDMRMAASGEPVWSDPRQILKGVMAKLADDGLHAVVACEFEFYLIDGGREPDGRIRRRRSSHGTRSATPQSRGDDAGGDGGLDCVGR